MTPDTSSYLTLGMAAIAVIVLGYAASIYIRFRNLQQDYRLIEQLHDEG